MDPILVGKAVTTDTSGNVHLLPRFGNRHGLIAGATGTGKTVTLMTLAESFSRIGVPVFLADVKGDVAGLAMPGTMNERIQQRLAAMGNPEYRNEASPVVFWDLYGKLGHPVRTTVSEMGPTLLGPARPGRRGTQGHLDQLRPGQRPVDRRHPARAAAPGAGRRGPGEPALELHDLMRTTTDGRGVINILGADQLILKPKLYSSFLLWLLSELFETLPEVGDLDKPRLVFVFDEAHLLFDDAPPALQQRIEQVVRIIRSKGVGVYFCSQFPDDVPDEILGQLGNRFQHALRAFTPRDQKAVKTAAQTFVANSALDVAKAIGELGTGEALVSTLQDKGVPMPVEKTLIAPPRCRMGAITEAERAQVRAGSPVGSRYDTRIDRESAAELLAKKAETVAEQAKAPPARTRAQDDAEEGGFGQAIKDAVFGTKRRQGMVETAAKQTARTVGNQIGRQIVRGILGSLFGGRR